jgi:hypothetical protein
MLKFRLPWEDGTSVYLNGNLYFAAFGGQTTTETRVVVEKGASKKEYDHKIYEEQMFYFNRMVRTQYYIHDVELPNIDHCFDCSRMVQVMERYVTQHDMWYKEGVRDGATGKLIEAIPRADVLKQIGVQLGIIADNMLKIDRSEMRGAIQASRRGGKRQESPKAGKASPQREGGAGVEEEIDYGGLFE